LLHSSRIPETRYLVAAGATEIRCRIFGSDRTYRCTTRIWPFR
jgi:hypothetical protein